MKKCNELKTEMKIGLILIAIFGLLNVVFEAPEIFRGIFFGAGIAFLIVGGMPEDLYEKLKVLKKRR